MLNARFARRAAVVGASAALVLSACGGGSSSSAGGDTSASGPRTGGTLYVLTAGDKIAHMDPQRNYTGVDLNFVGAFVSRTLTAYGVGPAPAGTQVVPDLATDTGTPDAEAKTWTFTLRDGVSFEDGSPITCDDVKYGISRSFATDVITDGPTYAISMFDVPKDKDGNSIYTGPYKNTPEGVAAYDKAVECSADGKTITFHLARSVPDFNYQLTLQTSTPVPKAADTGEKYDDKIVSSGPYKIETYEPQKQLVLVRNENWKQESDPVRKAYPDKIVMQFSVNPQVTDQRILRSTGDDAFAVGNDSIDPADLTTIFNDPATESRRSDGLDPFVRYLAINTKKVPNLKHRQALMAAMDREALLKLNGGTYAGEMADGVVKPNIGVDYAPTGVWESMLGEAVPDSGNVELAKKLIAESGEQPPPITLDYSKGADSQTDDKAAAIAKDSWEAAGFKVTLNPIEQAAYFPTIFDPAKQGSVSGAGWAPDWLNASTVIPELFTPGGGFPLSQWDDKAYLGEVDAAKVILDRDQQATAWQALSKKSMEQALVIPTRFSKEQLIFGTKVKAAGNDGKPYTYPAFGGPAYADLYVEQ